MKKYNKTTLKAWKANKKMNNKDITKFKKLFLKCSNSPKLPKIKL